MAILKRGWVVAVAGIAIGALGLALTLYAPRDFATFVIGHLNILTITFVPILIGLAIEWHSTATVAKQTRKNTGN